jgi:hypothetical protein
MEEVIAFEGIPKSSYGVRSSTLLGCQTYGDFTQMEKSMKRAQMRDEPLIQVILQSQNILLLIFLSLILFIERSVFGKNGNGGGKVY